MTKSELIAAVAQHNHIPLATADKMVNLLLKSCTKQLSNGGRIELRGFGSLFCKSYDSYTGRNPKTGELTVVSAKRRVRFRMSELLFQRINSDL
ncbi:MAG: HU family DNA-binding protein [Myxococcota bacterium]|nr:HU family DNA-binding protein [Myxococcota bacterium]MEC8381801.1 HU family DNA-binding protein [Myxococcota bacterium]